MTEAVRRPVQALATVRDISSIGRASQSGHCARPPDAPPWPLVDVKDGGCDHRCWCSRRRSDWATQPKYARSQAANSNFSRVLLMGVLRREMLTWHGEAFCFGALPTCFEATVPFAQGRPSSQVGPTGAREQVALRNAHLFRESRTRGGPLPRLDRTSRGR